jgi:hypothetical protein
MKRFAILNSDKTTIINMIIASDDFIKEHNIDCIPGEDLEIGWVLSEDGTFASPYSPTVDSTWTGLYEVTDLSDDIVAQLLELIENENKSE